MVTLQFQASDAAELAFQIARLSLAAAGALAVLYLSMIVILTLASWAVRR